MKLSGALLAFSFLLGRARPSRQPHCIGLVACLVAGWDACSLLALHLRGRLVILSNECRTVCIAANVDSADSSAVTEHVATKIRGRCHTWIA